MFQEKGASMIPELSLNKIKQCIYFIRDRYVMLDSDLASLYGVETRVLNQTVQRNKERFRGDDFKFRLTENEYDSLRSQFVTLENKESSIISDSYDLKGSLRSQFVILENNEKPSKSNGCDFDDSLGSQFVTLENRKGKHRKFLPTVYTEHGALMLSSILNSEMAVEINLLVVKAFVEFRKKSDTHSALEEKIENLSKKIDQNFDQQSKIFLHAIQQLTRMPSRSFLPTGPEIRKPENWVIQTIQKEVAQYYAISQRDLNSDSRERSILLPRQVAIFLIRKHTSLGFKEIGKLFGGKDHTTIMHAVQKIEAFMKRDQTICDCVALVAEVLSQQK